MYSKETLVDLVKEKALEFGEFKLAKGGTASFYLDCRKLTLDSAGANAVAEGILEWLGDELPDAVGGMAIGADPITGAVITLAGRQERTLRGFIVRKEPKGHGKGQQVEGPVQAGDEVVIVEDVVTTGGSSLDAIKAAEEFGLKVKSIVCIVDRLAGGREAFESRGYPFHSLITTADLGLE